MAAPKSGQVQGGNAQEGRRQLNAALQQYALVGPCPQDKSYNDSRQKAAEILKFLGILPGKAALCCLCAHLLQRSND